MDDKTVITSPCFECGQGQLIGDFDIIRDNQDYIIPICTDCVSQFENCVTCHINTRTFNVHAETGDVYCIPCFDSLNFVCYHCELISNYARNSAHTVDGHTYCNDCFHDQYFTCDDCGDITSNDNSHYNEDNDSYYCPNCYSSNSDNGCNFGNSINESPYVSKSFLNTNRIKRFYGIELECINKDNADDTRHEGFEVVEDGSLSSYGEEFRSGILQGDRGFELIKRQCDTLVHNGYKTDSSCGFHCHIDARDLTKEQLLNITSFIVAFENIIYSFLPKSRQSGSYSLPLSWSKPDLDAEKNTKCPRFEKEFLDGINRYRGFNLQAFAKHGTIEFRYHSGTIDYEKIQQWVNLCLRIVEYQKDIFWDRPRKFSTSSRKAYKLFYSTLQLDEKQIAYFEARKEKFNAVVLSGQPAILEGN